MEATHSHIHARTDTAPVAAPQVQQGEQESTLDQTMKLLFFGAYVFAFVFLFGTGLDLF